MKYGHFDDLNREYVITQPDTPLPWINYLGCQAYFGIISNTAGGYSFYRDARLRRLTRYRYNNVPLDLAGGIFTCATASRKSSGRPRGSPRVTNLKDYTCRHGMGYTVIGSTYKGIEAHTRYFVPLDENLEIWQLTVTNRRTTKATLSGFASIEFCLWDAQDDATNFQRNFNTGQVEVEDGVIYHKTEYRERRNHFAYFACSQPGAGFDTQREAFLGRYRNWDKPATVEAGQLTNSIAHGWSPMGAHQVKLELEPGETRQIVFVLGYHENPVPTKNSIPPGSQTINKKTGEAGDCEVSQRRGSRCEAFERLRQYWEATLGVFQVNTPDIHTNRMVNIWNAYQCMATFNMSRSASFYESGSGAGWGSATRTRTCWALCTWCLRARGSASWTWRPRNCPPAAPITSISRSPSGATTTSAADSTTIRIG
jgi:cellobiose phosphorylase